MQTRKLGLRGLALAFAGVLTLGLAACDDTETVPQAQNVTITVSPTGTVDLTVGQTFQVVASVQNAANTGVSYTSSNAAVATVDANGVVRAVAPGVATITAASAQDGNVRGAVVVRVTAATTPPVVTPPAQDSARVIISSIVDANNNPVNEASAGGTFFVRLDVTPGRADSLTVDIGGTTVCRQNFNAAATSESGTGVAAAAAAAEFVCAVTSTRTNANGTPMFPNGASTVRARLFDNGVVISSASRALTLANTNVVALTVVTTDSVISDDNGLLWRDGDVTVTGTPRIFTGGTTVSRVTVTLTGTDNDGDDVTLRETDETATNGAFSVTFDEEDLADLTDATLEITATSVTSTGSAGPQSGTTVLSIRYDNEAPEGDADQLRDTDSNGDPIEFIGADFDEELVDADLTTDDIEDFEDAGVGDVTVQFFVGEEGDFDDLISGDDEATEANFESAGGTEIDDPSDLEEFDGDELEIAALVCDGLGNCRVLSGFVFTVDFGRPTIVDISVPDTIFSVGESTAGQIDVELEDETGFQGEGLLVSATRLFSTGSTTSPTTRTICVIGDEANADSINVVFGGAVTPADYQGAEVGSNDSVCEPVEIDAPIEIPDVAGYYTFTIRAIDAGGNTSSAAETVRILVDQEAPSVSNIEFSANLNGGTTETFTAVLTDNLDLKDYNFAIEYQGLGFLPFTNFVSVDDSFGSPLTRRASVTQSVFFIDGITEDTNDGAGVTQSGNFFADGVRFSPQDQAGNVQAAGVGESDITQTQTFGGLTAIVEYDVDVVGSDDIICVDASCTDGAQSVTLRAVIGETADPDPSATTVPASRVYFYIRTGTGPTFTYRLVGVDTSASTTVTSGNVRRFSFTTTLTRQQVQGLGFGDGDNITIAAVAVDAGGDGIIEIDETELTAQD